MKALESPEGFGRSKGRGLNGEDMLRPYAVGWVLGTVTAVTELFRQGASACSCSPSPFDYEKFAPKLPCFLNYHSSLSRRPDKLRKKHCPPYLRALSSQSYTKALLSTQTLKCRLVAGAMLQT